MSNETKNTSPSGRYVTMGICTDCGKEYFSRRALRKHVQVKHGWTWDAIINAGF